jgi:hypothetical protein
MTAITDQVDNSVKMDTALVGIPSSQLVAARARRPTNSERGGPLRPCRLGCQSLRRKVGHGQSLVGATNTGGPEIC